jgi:hypothetical protein
MTLNLYFIWNRLVSAPDINEIVKASDILQKKKGFRSHLRPGKKSKKPQYQLKSEIKKYLSQAVVPLRKEPLKERLRRFLQRTYKSFLW